jgi:hypothetical protein
MTAIDHPQTRGEGLLAALNGRLHKAALMVFLFVVVAHWAEHLTQAWQIYVMDMPRPKAGGFLGKIFPVLVTSEWLHYGFAIVMLIGFVMLRHSFTGRARKWWDAAMWIQVWHHFEHLLLLLQALFGAYLLGASKPTSILQLAFPANRVEIHLFYNAIVFVPMVVAMWYHQRPRPDELQQAQCTCASSARA